MQIKLDVVDKKIPVCIKFNGCREITVLNPYADMISVMDGTAVFTAVIGVPHL